MTDAIGPFTGFTAFDPVGLASYEAAPPQGIVPTGRSGPGQNA
jgi:hypothetical protein